MHTPVAVTEQALARVAELCVDSIVALGGGSTTGLACLEGLAGAAGEIVSSPYWNPRPVEREGVLRLLEDAFAGRRPAA
jgi:hypothetical protein